MKRDESIRELRGPATSVVAERSPWVPASEMRRILEDTPADGGLLDDLAGVRSGELDEA